MIPLLLVLLVILILFGAGFALDVLWWIALVLLIVWIIGFFTTRAGPGGGRTRWYRW
ncbi:hydrophobic protein [Streptomyces sp. NPDC002896]|uniref:DUF5670 family protein n=1 Tax=Streptomyces sp. NPDC002896 TaxID=3154438 RepID=UPI003320800F